MLQNNQAATLPRHTLPEAIDAVQNFEASGGQLTRFSSFGHDPLQTRPDLLTQRETLFKERFPSFDEFFHTVVNNDTSLFSL